MTPGRWQKFRHRSGAVGARDTLSYYLGTSLLERLGVKLVHVFAWPQRVVAGEEAAPPDTTCEILTATSEWTPDDRLRLVRHGGAGLWGLSDLSFADGWRCAVGRRAGQLACVCWLTPTERYAPTGGTRCWLIQRCFTFMEHRGRGDYPRTLRFAVRTLLAEEPATPILIESSMFNRASLRGIQKAGFEEIGRRVQVARLDGYRLRGGGKLATV